MKKVIFGIFAHPDDEAFLSAGTLLIEKAAGNDIHLICVTAGECGTNPSSHENIAEIRLTEWKTACTLIGADSMHHLGYRDGCLDNNNYHQIATMIDEIVTSTLQKYGPEIQVEFMTMDLNGITGHLDHIFVARVACYEFYSLKSHDKRLTRIRLGCITRDYVPTSNCDWLYMEAGRTMAEIEEVVDARQYKDQILAIIRAHHTQREDGEALISRLGENVGLNYFLVRT